MPNNLIQVSCQIEEQRTNHNIALSGPKRFEHGTTAENNTNGGWLIAYHSFNCFPIVSI